VFVNGNYRMDPEDPEAGWQYRLWEDTWTQHELDMHWRMVTSHKRTK